MSTIIRYRGDTAPDQFSVPYIITGFTFRMTVDTRQDPDDDSTLVYELAGVITDEDNVGVGEFEFSPDATQADQDPAVVLYYDVEQTDAAGKIKTIDKGKIKYKQDISK